MLTCGNQLANLVGEVVQQEWLGKQSRTRAEQSFVGGRRFGVARHVKDLQFRPVLAGNFGPYAVPRWADEGLAVLSEPVAKIEQHRMNVTKAAREQKLFTVHELIHLNDYPEPRRLEAFYAQSVMLVDFLAQKKGPTVLVQFIRDGLKEGYEGSLRRHYDMDFTTLDRDVAQIFRLVQSALLKQASKGAA